MLPAHFGLHLSDPHHKDEAAQLSEDEIWLLPNLANDDMQFQHAIIHDTICNGFFRSSKSLGMKHKDQFVPMVPIPTITYICSIIRAFEIGSATAGDLNGPQNADGFNLYMDMLKEFGAKNPGCLLNAQLEITLEYLKLHPQPASTPHVEMNIGPDQELDEDNLREIKELLGDAVPDVDEWREVRALTQNAKGKARAAGPSR
ncbi:hypothetical protein FRC06_002580, partial [Ceratobasidium sp. 370]